MDSLGDVYAKLPMPDYGIYVPDDGICPTCDRLRRDHPGVEKLLAVRGLKYGDPVSGRLVVKAGIPYCRCKGDK